MKKKAIRDRRTAIKQAMVEEEKRSTNSMLQIHNQWRSIMRSAKLKEQREDIDWLSKKHVHQVEVKDRVIGLYQMQMDESEAQYHAAQIKHLTMLDILIDLHHLGTMKMEEQFSEQLKSLEDSFVTERKLMTTGTEKQKKELKDIIAAMREEAEEIISERKQYFESSREELKSKNIVEYNMLKLSLEAGLEELERRIDHTHQSYLATTEANTVSFKNLVAKDEVVSRVIEQRMRNLIQLHEKLSYWRVRMINQGFVLHKNSRLQTPNNNKEWDTTNKKVKDEKEYLLSHYIHLKRLLDRIQHHEHNYLKEVSKNVLEAKNILLQKLTAVQRVQIMARRVARLETEHEKIFPFDPLHCSAIPLVPGVVLEQELDGDALVKRAERKNELGVGFLLKPGLLEAEPKAPAAEIGNKRFHWASWAVSDAGDEVEEINCMINFDKRFNKVKLDTLAIQMERNRLSKENTKLANGLRNYLNSATIPEHIKKQHNILVFLGEEDNLKPKQTLCYLFQAVHKKLKSPRMKPPPVYRPPPVKTPTYVEEF
uniref:Dynein regulatory complex subunit 2 n=1 Tax=Physcomitrium patens TaxID=3218 RepID=A0A2K1KP35_PHYPA|nr:hypothetical protein PHYPA_006440 [Physcomitrium patens]